MAGARRPPRVTSSTRGSVRALHWWPTRSRAPRSFFIVPAAPPASLQRLLHRVSTFLALVSERRTPALVLPEPRPRPRAGDVDVGPSPSTPGTSTPGRRGERRRRPIASTWAQRQRFLFVEMFCLRRRILRHSTRAPARGVGVDTTPARRPRRRPSGNCFVIFV